MRDDFQYILYTKINLGMYSRESLCKFGKHIDSTNTSDVNHVIGGTDIFLPEHYLLRKLELFEKICATSIFNQTDPDFTWVLMCDVNTPVFIKNIIADIVKDPPIGLTVVISYSDTGVANHVGLSKSLKESIHDDTNIVFTAMLDVDDGLENNFVKIMKAHIELLIEEGNVYNKVVLNPRSWYTIVYDGNTYTHAMGDDTVCNYVPETPTMEVCGTTSGLIEEIIRDANGDYELQTIGYTDHTNLWRVYPIIAIGDIRYMITINGHSIFNTFVPRSNHIYSLTEGKFGEYFSCDIAKCSFDKDAYVINTLAEVKKYSHILHIDDFDGIHDADGQYDMIVVGHHSGTIDDVPRHLRKGGSIVIKNYIQDHDYDSLKGMHGNLIRGEANLLIITGGFLLGNSSVKYSQVKVSIDEFFDSLLPRTVVTDNEVVLLTDKNILIPDDVEGDLRMPNVYMITPPGVDGHRLLSYFWNATNNVNKDFSCERHWHGGASNNITREEYLSYFGTRKYVQDFSVDFSSYYFTNHNSYYSIRDNCHNPKIITILRNPIDRFMDQYLFFRSVNEQYKKGSSSLDSFKGEERVISAILSDIFSPYLDFGMYFYHLRELYNVFGYDNVKVVLYEDYMSSKRGVSDIFKFLGISDTVTDPPQNPNGTQDYSCIGEISKKDIIFLRGYYHDANNILESMLNCKLDWNYNSKWYDYLDSNVIGE